MVNQQEVNSQAIQTIEELEKSVSTLLEMTQELEEQVYNPSGSLAEDFSRWDGVETTQKLAELQGSSIDLSVVLEKFSPDHLHKPWKDLPWRLRRIRTDQGLQRLLKTSYGIIADKDNSHFHNEARHIGEELVILSLTGATFPLSMERVLSFPMVDFITNYKSDHYRDIVVNTTRVPKVKEDIYSVYIGGLGYPSIDGVLSRSGQSLISAMLEARVK